VRGPNYLRDKKKIPAAEPVFSLAATELLQVDKPTPHIAQFLPSLRSTATKRIQNLEGSSIAGMPPQCLGHASSVFWHSDDAIV